MATIVNRVNKGSPVSNTELDSNFTNLNAELATKSSGTFTGVVTAPTPESLDVVTNTMPLAKPSLNLNFVSSETLDSRVTFARASSATRTNRKGLIETVAAGVPRFDYDAATGTPRGLLIEETRTNSLTYSNDLTNAAWSLQRTTVIANASVAPDGTTTAAVTTGTGATGGAMGVNQTVSAAASTAYVISGFFKAGTSTWAILIGFDGTTAPNAWFDLINGVVGTVNAGMSNPVIQSFGNGWYRCSVVCTTGVSATSLRWQVAHSTANNSTATSATLTLYVWGTQLELGAFASSYVSSTVTHTGRASTATYINSAGNVQTAASGVARYQYNPQNLTVAPFLLLEAAATNLCTYSQDFTQTAWVSTNSTKTTGIADPAGGVTAATITSTSANGIVQNGNAVVAIGTTYTVSIWLRRRTGTGVVGIRAVENANIPVTITSTWAKYSLTVTATQTAGRVGVYCNTIGDEIDFWGGQLETGTFASSYIPTTTAAATRAADTSTSAQTTRAADSATITGTNFFSWYNSIEGTLFAKLLNIGRAASVTYPRLIAFTGSDVNTDEISLYTITQGAGVGFAYGSVTSSGTNTFDSGNVASVADFWSAAIAYKANDTAYAASGLVSTTDTTVTIPVCNQLLIFGSAKYQPMSSGYVQRVIYYPVRLSNTTLQAITK